MPAHKHKYVIPVEWEIADKFWEGDGTPSRYRRQTVTKLRCECGEETVR